MLQPYRTHSFSRGLISVCLALLFIAVASQERHAIAKLGVNEGLSQGSVFDIEQDDKGFLWIATADGLNRFDGYNFELLSGPAVDSFPLAFTRLRNLFHTKDAMWVTSSQTMIISRIDLVTGEIKQIFDFAEKNGVQDVCPFRLSGDTLWNLVSDQGIIAISVSQGKIIQQFPLEVNPFPVNSLVCYDSTANILWYTNEKYSGLCSFSLTDKKFQLKTFLEPGTNDTIPVCGLTQCADGSLRLGSAGQIVAYAPATGAMTIYPLGDPASRPDLVCAVLAEGNDVTWCGANDGSVYRLDERTGKWELKSNPALTMNGVGHRIISFHMDRSKNLWVGTDPTGLLRFDTKQKPFNHVSRDPQAENGLKSNFMKCFAEMGDEVFIGTYDQGINVLNTRNRTYRYIKGLDGSQAVVYNVTVDQSHRIWACAGNGIGVAEPGATQLTRPLVNGNNEALWHYGKTIYATKTGTLLVGTFDGMYAIVPKGTAYEIDSIDLPANVESFFTDKDGNLWMGAGEGMYFSKGGDPHGLKPVIPNTGLVKCIYQLPDGSMWAGTDRGLLRVDAVNNRISKVYTEKDGMPNTFVYGIIGDEEGDLWMSTNKGITRFDPEEETFRNYSVTDGLQSNEFNTNAFYKTASGEFYFGGVNGFNHFYPAEIKDNPFAPECVVTGFKIFDKPYALDSTIEYKMHIALDYTNNNLLIEYTALEFSDPARNKFRYRLLGLDTNWVEAGDARFARFVNLDPGNYTFQLKAANSDGVWNNIPKELRIIITPPFWKTAGFIIGVSVISLLLVVIAIRLYFRRQLNLKTRELQLKQSARMSAIIETEEKERKRVAEELHDGLGQLLSTARLNISGIGTDLQEKDVTLWKNSLDLLDEACSEVRSISHNMMPGALIRSGLIEAIDDLVSKINAAGKLEVTFDTELNERFPETLEVAVYRITQEILNNMIRHAEASRILITLEKTGATLELTIADNGKSFDVASIPGSEGIGWKNIYSRVEILNGNIAVTSEKERGTSVFLSVPLN